MSFESGSQISILMTLDRKGEILIEQEQSRARADASYW